MDEFNDAEEVVKGLVDEYAAAEKSEYIEWGEEHRGHIERICMYVRMHVYRVMYIYSYEGVQVDDKETSKNQHGGRRCGLRAIMYLCMYVCSDILCMHGRESGPFVL